MEWFTITSLLSFMGSLLSALFLLGIIFLICMVIYFISLGAWLNYEFKKRKQRKNGLFWGQ